MDKFLKADKVYYPKEYEEGLTNAWVVRKGKETERDQYWILVRSEDLLDLPEDQILPGYIFEIKEKFILKNNDKRVKSYKEFSKFLGKALVFDKDLNYQNEINKYVVKYNSRILVVIKVIADNIKRVFKYFVFVILGGLIKLIFGDLISYFKNMHGIYVSGYELKKSELERSVTNSVGGNLSKIDSKIEVINHKVDTYRKENAEINKSMIAVIISIISLLFSLKK